MSVSYVFLVYDFTGQLAGNMVHNRMDQPKHPIAHHNPCDLLSLLAPFLAKNVGYRMLLEYTRVAELNARQDHTTYIFLINQK
jgi:hypothetical protein